MTVFVDTSAFFAILDADDANHKKAAAQWKSLLESDARLVTTNYVMLETSVLAQNRLGTAAMRVFQEDVVPVTSVIWVDEKLHNAAWGLISAAGRRKLSLVDCVSFEAMRISGIKKSFSFDRHFRESGFELLP